ncbi:CDP-alcohol phosphatidyltransferase family protein [Streptomyces sp. NPDC001793]|uniref:CDP-alcohol phosphatidyltransferase family protein n=1 Tax=Streptomyces sp. NPDC001793 TaxID=3154657 RepID=UPI003333C1F3
MAGQVRCGARLFGADLVAGAVAQLVLLEVLCRVVGLGPVGWLAGVAFAAVTGAVLVRAVRGSGLRSFGPANRVTLARATLVGGVTALVADSFARPVPVAALVGPASVALALDAVDGRVARRTGTATALGARFDMEVDAFLILVLSVHAAGPLGPWVPVIGALRYLFVAASWVLPWLCAPLPPSMARKTVAAVQGVVLVAAGAGFAPRVLERGAVAGALALLVWSFGRDVGWLWRSRERAGGASAVRAGGGESVPRPG